MRDYLIGAGVVGCVYLPIMFLIISLENKPKPRTTYECPCQVEQLVTDVISHTNKDGMTTVTTYIDVSKCVGVVGN